MQKHFSIEKKRLDDIVHNSPPLSRCSLIFKFLCSIRAAVSLSPSISLGHIRTLFARHIFLSSLRSVWPWKCLTISFCYFPIIFQYQQLQTISTCDIGSLQMGSQLRAGFLDLKDGPKRSLMLMCIWKITDRKFFQTLNFH